MQNYYGSGEEAGGEPEPSLLRSLHPTAVERIRDMYDRQRQILALASRQKALQLFLPIPLCPEVDCEPQTQSLHPHAWAGGRHPFRSMEPGLTHGLRHDRMVRRLVDCARDRLYIVHLQVFLVP